MKALKWQVQRNRAVTKLSAWNVSILFFDIFIGSFPQRELVLMNY